LFKFWKLCVFEPPFGGIETTYDVRLGFIGKCVVDFLLVLTELLLGVTAEALRANRSKIMERPCSSESYMGDTQRYSTISVSFSE